MPPDESRNEGTSSLSERPNAGAQTFGSFGAFAKGTRCKSETASRNTRKNGYTPKTPRAWSALKPPSPISSKKTPADAGVSVSAERIISCRSRQPSWYGLRRSSSPGCCCSWPRISCLRCFQNSMLLFFFNLNSFPISALPA